MLFKIRHFINKQTLIMLYYSLVFPHLNYVIEIWGSSQDTHLNRILILQKRALRMISHLENFAFYPSDPLFYKHHIHKVHDIFILRIAKFIYNCLIKNTPTNFHYWFKETSLIHNHNTRSKYVDINNSTTTRTLFVPSARTTYYALKLTKVQGPKIWNNLPTLIRVENLAFSTFIKKLKIYLLELYEH